MSRRRMPARVADISEARSTWLRWRYLSITARSVARLSAAAVQKVTLTIAPGAMLQAQRERSHRIEPGVERRALGAFGRPRRRVEGGERMAGAAVAAEPALPVDLQPEAGQRRLRLGDEVRRQHALVGAPAGACARTPAPGARPATRRSRTGSGTPGAPRRRARRRARPRTTTSARGRASGRPGCAGPTLAKLDVVFGADPDRGVRPRSRARPRRTRPGRRGSWRGSRRPRSGAGCWVSDTGPRLAVPAQVEEAAEGVAQGIVAPARDAMSRPQRLQPAPLARSAHA